MHLHHLIHPSDSATDDSGKLGFLFETCKFYYFEYSESTHQTNSRRIDFAPESDFYTIVGSYNGLVCFYGYHNPSVIICNPITKEYVTLPQHAPIVHSDKCFFFCGFGYIPITDEYKVVRMYKLQKESKFVEVEVYTLGSGKGWRYVGKLAYGIIINANGGQSGQIGVFANGALHWLVDGEKVVAFHLADEMFRDIPLPAILQGDFLRTIFDVRIQALGDYLMCADDGKQLQDVSTVDMWLLKRKNGLHDMKGEGDCNWVNWSEEFSLDDRRMLPFALTKSGAVLCIKYLIDRSTIHCYDIKSSSVEMLASFDGHLNELPSPHINTLVSLRDLGEENTKLMRSGLGTKSKSLEEKQQLEGKSQDAHI